MNEVAICFWMTSLIFALLALVAGVVDRDQAAEWLATVSMGGFLVGMIFVFIDVAT